MANLTHKFAKSRPSLRFLTSLNTHLVPKSDPSLASQHTHFAAPKPEFTVSPIFSLGGDKVEIEPYKCSHIFPSFPFGYCLNAIPSTGSGPLRVDQVEGVDSEDSRTVWADSVKKKRKKKMNKHKYKKLRKRLRRKART
ncbi:uncharacterized protein LOC133830177 [Humulus lupulus]|uniref:uncharacterized protein LOC133830177 n=1 Tax=Humulus lupulus TaxID=3486 RepID=UPI002B404EB8|nr:uncharacterized protein LOC133830177 [Humulus lupulus]